ncbi:MAG: outer membrane porin, OprD family, partial [Sulfuricurvum sp.]|nr:outer membrane porin, OprD family [Sulfuricurvum sp.]
MKLVKMSLAAAVLLGASAFALDNVKVSGDAKVFYNTNNADYGIDDNNDHNADRYQSGLFEQGTTVDGIGGSAADVALRLGVTGDLLKGVSFGVTANAVSTLGLENNLVSNTWTGAHSGVEDNRWVSEAWLATTMGNTTAKIGRMELDTPLAFSEAWSVAKNTFDAAVVINQDLPDTTLVGAWVGKSNGVDAANASTSTADRDGILRDGANFQTFAVDGAYAVALVNNSFKPATVQAWYYNVLSVADAYWLQADINCQLVKGVTIGAQYANMDPKGLLAGIKDSSAYAFKLGYAMDALKVSAAYSKVDDEGTLKIANVATNNLSGAQSKLYTEAFWNYGYVGAPDATSWNVTAKYDAGFAKLGAYYTDASIDDTKAQVVTKADNTDMTEVALTASKSFGPLDATLAYISTDADDKNSGKEYST